VASTDADEPQGVRSRVEVARGATQDGKEVTAADHAALDGGLDGLTLHRRILESAPAPLLPGGRVYLEIAFDQGDLARDVAGQYPALQDVRVLKDFGGRDRVLTARKSA
jgi:methylase of polypeptide subunit release factors